MSLPVGIMPRLEGLSVGKLDGLFSKRDPTSTELTELLLERSDPKIMCQSQGQIKIPLFLRSISDGPDKTAKRQIPILHRHVNIMRAFTIVPGSTTYLYINRMPRESPYGRRCGFGHERLEQGPQERPEVVGSWLGDEILNSLQELKGIPQQEIQSLRDTTRIIIGGAICSSVRKGNSAVWEKAELERMEAVLKTTKSVVTDDGRRKLRKVKIEGLSGSDMSPCPLCHKGCINASEDNGGYHCIRR